MPVQKAKMSDIFNALSLETIFNAVLGQLEMLGLVHYCQQKV